uniref:Uncharacterized protein n=1 Tax=Arundo donax TaxID=35708 RepID=A0A0A9C945_ARUDO
MGGLWPRFSRIPAHGGGGDAGKAPNSRKVRNREQDGKID